MLETTCVNLNLSACSNIMPDVVSPRFSSPKLSSTFIITRWFFGNWLLISDAASRITSRKSTVSLCKFRDDRLSILVRSKMFSVKAFNLLAFLIMIARNSSCSWASTFFLDCSISAKPRTGWIGSLSSWAAMLRNSDFRAPLKILISQKDSRSSQLSSNSFQRVSNICRVK